MAIAKTKIGGVWFYDWLDIHAQLTNVYPCISDMLLEQYEGKMVESVNDAHHFISRKSIVPFLRFVGERGTHEAANFLYQVEKGIMTDAGVCRKLSRKYRWEIAFEQEYKCMHCKTLLHPKAAQIKGINERRRSSPVAG